MLRLFLEGKELELTDDVQVAITKQFEELSNPTTIINDWSKTVSIPFTHKNDAIFGYFFRPDKLTTYMPSGNYLTTAPTSIKKWNGSAYVNDSLSSGNIVCDINAQYVQVGFQYQDWKYSSVKNFTCNNDWHSFEFNYIPEEDYRFEFSFRDMSSDAPNNEVYYVQWDLYDRNLTENETYVVSFKHKKSGNNYIIYDYSLSKKQSLTGINFDPLQKLDFRLEWNGATLMTGYAKLNEIKQKDGNGTYNITLFGQLGKVLQEMKKITFDNSTNDTQYLIHGEDYVDTYITKDLVYDSWNSNGQTTYDLKKIGDSGYNVTDIIGFAPNNSFSEGFDYESYQHVTNGTQQISMFTDTLGDDYKNATGLAPDSVIPNGMLPREIGEYRSYLQLPFIYFNKLFRIFQKKAEDLTGYEFELNKNWFNSMNPYWYNIVYALKSFNTSKSEHTLFNKYRTNFETPVWNVGTYGNTLYSRNKVYRGDSSEQIPILKNEDTYLAEWRFPNKHYTFQIDLDIPDIVLSCKNYVDSHDRLYNIYYLFDDLYIVFEIVNDSDEVIDSRKIRVCAINDGNVLPASEQNIDRTITFNKGRATVVPDVADGWSTWGFSIKDSFIVNSYGGTNAVRLRMKSFFRHNTTGAVPVDSPIMAAYGNSYVTFNNQQVKIAQNMGYSNITVTDTITRSFANFTLNDLWDKDFNVFEEILNYCKMYRIAIQVDDINKKIKFIPYYKLFEGYKVVNWTDKVDKSKDFTVKPVSFDKKYITYNYKDSQTQLGKEYKEEFGLNFGGYRIVTDYNFNNDTEKLFDKVVGSIVNTNNVLSWNTLYDHKFFYSFPSEISVLNYDKDKKEKSIFGSYYFHCGAANFSTQTDLNMRSVCITDDTFKQQSLHKYLYAQGSDESRRIVTEKYPKLDIVRDNYMCLFNVPSRNYTYVQNYSNKRGIYNIFWSNYINERYNRQNKLITCYVTLKPSDFVNFSFKNFVKIDDTLCIVNKIYDYDVTSSNSTKVDLLTVQNIEGYTDDTFFRNIDVLTLHFLPTTYLSGNVMSNPSQLGTFESVTDVTFANGDTTYTTNNVRFTISGNNVYYQTLTKYVDKDDLSFNVTLKNEHYTGSFHCVRYAVYPYPEIKLYESDGETERSTIYPGTRNYKLAWYGTETYGLENKPTVTIDIHGTGSATIDASTWNERDVMIAEGDDEWFRTEYIVNFNTNMTNYSGSYVRVTIVDKEGWHDTRDFPVSI